MESCGVQLPQGQPAEALLAKAQDLLRGLFQDSQAPSATPREDSRGADLPLVPAALNERPIVEKEVPPPPGAKRRKGTPGSGYMLFVNENFSRVRAELSQAAEEEEESVASVAAAQTTQPSFSSIAKEAAAQWRALPRHEQSEYTTRAAALRESRPDGAPEAPRATGAPRGKNQSLQSYKRKWIEQELAKWEEELRAEWEAFSSDEVSAQLMAFKLSGLPGHDRLGSTLDAVVSQRMAGPAGPGGAPALLSRLGLANSHLPHPAALYAEWEVSSRDSVGAELETATAECLRRYRMLPPHRMAALWSLVASRMLRQEERIRNTLCRELGMVEAMDAKAAELPQPAYEHFRAQRLRSCSNTGAAVLQLPEGGEDIDPLWELALEEEFLNLDEGELMRWFPEPGSQSSDSMAGS